MTPVQSTGKFTGGPTGKVPVLLQAQRFVDVRWNLQWRATKSRLDEQGIYIARKSPAKIKTSTRAAGTGVNSDVFEMVVQCDKRRGRTNARPSSPRALRSKRTQRAARKLPKFNTSSCPKLGLRVQLQMNTGAVVDAAVLESVEACDIIGNRVASFVREDNGQRFHAFVRSFGWRKARGGGINTQVHAVPPFAHSSFRAVEYDGRCSATGCRRMSTFACMCDEHWAQWGVKPAEEPGKGLGLQTTRAFAADQLIVPYHGTIHKPNEVDETSDRLLELPRGGFVVDGREYVTRHVDGERECVMTKCMGSLANEPNPGESITCEFCAVPIARLQRMGVPMHMRSAVYLSTPADRGVASGVFLLTEYNRNLPWRHAM